MRALVVGGAGFLGYHICSRLLAEGHRVEVLDTLLTGSKENILPGAVFLSAFPRLGTPYDLIFHLACPASPVFYKKYPVETLEAGSLLTLRLARLAGHCNARLFFASSSEVYGNAQVVPTPETYWGNVDPIGPRSCYDESKRFSEAVLATYRTSFGVDVRIARFFNVYGPRMRLDDGRVVPTFMRQVLAGEPLSIEAPGTQTRALCYVDDAVDAVMALMSAPSPEPSVIAHPEYPYVFNIGNPQEVSMLALAAAVCQAAGQPFVYLPTAGRVQEIARRVPDITRMKEQFGWQPAISLPDGLARTLDYYRGREVSR